MLGEMATFVGRKANLSALISMGINLYRGVRAIIASLAVIILSTACHKKQEQPFSNLVIDTAYWQENVPLFEDQNGLSIKVDIEYVYPKNNDPLLCKMNHLLFGDSTVNKKEAVDRFLAFLAQDFSGYENIADSLREKGIQPQTPNDIYYRINNDILYVDDDVFSMEVCSSYTDTQGKNYNQQAYYNVSMSGDLRQLTEGDLFVEGYEEPLARILLKQMMVDFDVKNANQLESVAFLNPEEVMPNNNFSISEEGITYCFNEYKPAFDTHGAVYVFVGYEQLGKLLKPNSVVGKFIAQ